MTNKPKVICLGEALLDRLGPSGEDPATAPLHKCYDRPGGAPANVACALARLGTPSALISRLGTDETGESLVKLLTKRGVGLEGCSEMKRARLALYWFTVKLMGNAFSRDLLVIEDRGSPTKP